MKSAICLALVMSLFCLMITAPACVRGDDDDDSGANDDNTGDDDDTSGSDNDAADDDDPADDDIDDDTVDDDAVNDDAADDDADDDTADDDAINDDTADDDTIDDDTIDDDTADDDTVDDDTIVDDDSSFEFPVEIEMIDGTGDIADRSPLVIDPDGTRHIAAVRGRTLSLYHVAPDGAVDVEPLWNGAKFATLAQTSDGFFLVAYQDAFIDGLWLLRETEDGWLNEAVDALDPWVSRPALVAGLDGARLVYWTTEDGQSVLRYARETQKGWSIESITPFTPGSYGQPGMALTLDGVPHVTVYDRTAGDLWYGIRTEDGWTWENPAPRLVQQGYSSFDVDTAVLIGPDGVYLFDSGPAAARMTTNADGQWQTAKILSLPSLLDGYGIAAALGTDNRPRVVFGTIYTFLWQTETALIYAEPGPAGWHREIIGNSLRSPEIALDAGDEPQITARNGQLLHLFQPASSKAWNDQVLTERKELGDGTSFAVDAVGGRHLLYIWRDLDALDYKPVYAHSTGTGWTSEVLDIPMSHDYGLRLVAEPNGTPHLFFVSTYTYDLCHWVRGPEGWTSEVIAADAGISMTPLVARQGDGTWHVVYFCVDPWEIRYAKNAGAGWSIETIVPISENMNGPAMAVDESGVVHVTYTIWWTPVTSYYANNAEGDWTVEVLFPGSEVNGHVRLAADGLTLHAAYYDSQAMELIHAWKIDDQWQNEIVPYHDLISSPNLAVWDDHVALLISNSPSGLDLAVKTGGEWMVGSLVYDYPLGSFDGPYPEGDKIHCSFISSDSVWHATVSLTDLAR